MINIRRVPLELGACFEIIYTDDAGQEWGLELCLTYEQALANAQVYITADLAGFAGHAMRIYPLQQGTTP